MHGLIVTVAVAFTRAYETWDGRQVGGGHSSLESLFGGFHRTAKEKIVA